MKRFLCYLLFLALAVGASAQQNLLEKGFEGRMRDNDAISRKYIIPSRILPLGELQEGVSNTEVLLAGGFSQLTTNGAGSCILSTQNGKKASLLLDFGKELNGGIEIAAAIRSDKKPLQVRIRYGESVSEAMSDTGGATPLTSATNDHAMRDFILEIPWLGTIQTGDSGFRFVRIDLLDEEAELPIQAVRAILKYRDIPYLGSFRCDNERLNSIWETGAYTVHLNMQDYLWDGIKRDRLVWLGDIHPEVMTIAAVFGANDVVNKSLDFGRATTPLPQWMNGMCSYSLWWIISQRDWYLYQGDHAYLDRQREYLKGLLRQVIAHTDGNRESLSGGTRFLDWPTSEMPEVIHAGLQAMMVLTLEAGNQLCEWLGERTLAAECLKAIEHLRTYTPPHQNNKQAAAMLTLAGMVDQVKTAREVIVRDGANGFSTFFGYYMLNALSTGGTYEEALQIISDYWGLMLDLGATTFWEDLDYEVAKGAARIDDFVPAGKYDVHADGGAYCYVGLRHSLCHGWASGPTAWLSQYVLGVTPIEPGCKTVQIKPHLCNLNFAEGTFPTPYGIITIHHVKRKDGSIESKIEAPEGVTIIQ